MHARFNRAVAAARLSKQNPILLACPDCNVNRPIGVFDWERQRLPARRDAVSVIDREARDAAGCIPAIDEELSCSYAVHKHT